MAMKKLVKVAVAPLVAAVIVIGLMAHLTDVAKADAATDTLTQLTLDAIAESYGPATIATNVYISGSYAAVGFNADVMGGVKLFSSTSGQWHMIGGGGGMPLIGDLENVGIPASAAQNLIDQIYGATPSVDCVPDGSGNCIAHQTTNTSTSPCTFYDFRGRPHTVNVHYSWTVYQIRVITGQLQEYTAATTDAGNGDCSVTTTWDPSEPNVALNDANLP